MKKKYLLLLTIMVLLPSNIFATSGRLKKDSIINCNGQYYGRHGNDNHWHSAIKNGDYWYADEKILTSNPCGNNNYNSTTNNSKYNATNATNNNSNNTSQSVQLPKNSDTSLKEIKINDENISINKNMYYETKMEKINIHAVANDDKATIEYRQEQDLLIGENTSTIKVIAENGNASEYKILVKRIALSDNKDFKIYYNEKELTKSLIQKTIQTIDVDNKIKTIEFKYKLDDKNAKIKFSGNRNLKEGENKIKIVIIAENGSKDTYTMIVNRTSKIVEVLAYITIFSAPIIGVIYFLIKKNKKGEKI